MRKRWFAATLAAAGSLASGATLALASTARNAERSAGGSVRVFATGGDGSLGTIVVVGAIGDYGKTLSMTKAGKPDPNGDYVKITLQKGTLEVNSVQFNKQTSNAPPTILDRSTCSFAFIATGKVTVFNGTGHYKGISGTITITTNFGGIAPRYISGSKHGRCHFGNNVKPIVSRGWILGHGTVRFR
jgi:hypothetical protein